jgi:hypothetical protein
VLQVALAIAVKCEAHLTVLFSYRLLPGKDERKVREWRNQLEAKAKEEFARLEKKVIAGNGRASYEFRSEIGFLSDRISSFVNDDPPQLVVMGQALIQSMNEQKGLLLNEFIKKLHTPVVIVPEDVRELDFFDYAKP